MTNINDDQTDHKGVSNNRKKEVIQTVVTLLFWPSIVFGPCSFFLVIITWNTPGVEGRWIPFVATPVFFILIVLKIWLDKQPE